MRINLLSSFAAGILLTTTICGAVYFMGQGDSSKTASKSSGHTKTVSVQLSDGDMKKKLEAKGYVVKSKAEYDKDTKEAKTAEQKPATPEEPKTETVTKVIVNVSQGMTSIDVGNMLVKANLIQDAYAFSTDIEQKGLQNKLRPGTFVVDSKMSYDQVIAAIFQS